jgi:hypothetical protein
VITPSKSGGNTSDSAARTFEACGSRGKSLRCSRPTESTEQDSAKRRVTTSCIASPSPGETMSLGTRPDLERLETQDSAALSETCPAIPCTELRRVRLPAKVAGPGGVRQLDQRLTTLPHFQAHVAPISNHSGESLMTWPFESSILSFTHSFLLTSRGQRQWASREVLAGVRRRGDADQPSDVLFRPVPFNTSLVHLLSKSNEGPDRRRRRVVPLRPGNRRDLIEIPADCAAGSSVAGAKGRVACGVRRHQE